MHPVAASRNERSCPACQAPMRMHVFPRQLHGEILLDLCFPCQGIWFDEFESAQLAPAGILELFRLLHEHREEARLPWRTTLSCPHCRERLIDGLDRTKNGHFSYHRCPQKHGRFNSFSAFMMEKGFVRQLNGAEIAELSRQLPSIRCSGCGAPVDIRRQNVCGHCRSPLVVLDPDAVAKALDDFGSKAQRQARIDPIAYADALLANERMKLHAERERQRQRSDIDLADLVVDGVEALWRFLRH